MRQFWARRPGSAVRPQLFKRLYPYLPLGGQGEAVLQHVYGVGLEAPGAPGFSHLVRWTASARAVRLLAPDFAAAVADEDPVATVLASLPAPGGGVVGRWRGRRRWRCRRSWPATCSSPQGDRMLMGNSVEGRFPFLDHRLIELAARLPVRFKLRGLAGKWVLKRYARGRVPASVLERPKFPYRAPATRRLVGPEAPAWSRELLAPSALRAVGVFDPDKVGLLVSKLARSTGAASESDAMSITAVATTQLLARALAPAALAPAEQRAAVVLEAA